MRRLAWVCLALALFAAGATSTAPANSSRATDATVLNPDTPRGTAEPDTPAVAASPNGTEPAEPSQESVEAGETEPLVPIETQNSIRVNANVSLPQDI